MTGKTLALTPRDRDLLSEVQRCGVLTREHVVRLKLFASKTRANERLRRLTAAGYLTARPQPLIAGGPRLLYLPGKLLVASRAARGRLLEASDLFLEHELGLVDIRLAFEGFGILSRWSPAADLMPLNLGLVPDAFVEYQFEGLTFCAFIEYDRGTETLGRLERKIRGYLDLAFSGRFERAFGRKFFRALFVTDSAARLATISRMAATLTDRIVRLTTRSAVVASGPLAPIWRRPGTDALESLIHS
jgi:hypothetical protein